MTNEVQKKANEFYASLASAPTVGSESSGRYTRDSNKEDAIWSDVFSKIDLKANMSVLDIGCGFGGLLDFIIKTAAAMNLKLTLFDIPEVITRITKEYNPAQLSGFQLCPGIFPSVGADRLDKEFDRIVVYSVLHYVDDAKAFVGSLVERLAKGGKLFIGDVPNVNKKGRFLASDFGRKFEAEYRGVQESEVQQYRDHFEYAQNTTSQNRSVNDSLICSIFSEYRAKGYNVYVLPQPLNLPFGYTREDVLIERP